MTRAPETATTLGFVTRNRAVAGFLAISTLALAASGESLAITHTGGALGLFILAFAAPVGMTAWVALGAPMTRSDLDA